MVFRPADRTQHDVISSRSPQEIVLTTTSQLEGVIPNSGVRSFSMSLALPAMGREGFSSGYLVILGMIAGRLNSTLSYSQLILNGD